MRSCSEFEQVIQDGVERSRSSQKVPHVRRRRFVYTTWAAACIPIVAHHRLQVFFSSSAQIGRLIENLSRGMDAGSFNIMPGQGGRSQGPVGHSTSSSLGSEADMRWTVEERLEHMLGSMGAT